MGGNNMPLSRGMEETHLQAMARSLDLIRRATRKQQQALSKRGRVYNEEASCERNGESLYQRDGSSAFPLLCVYSHQVESPYVLGGTLSVSGARGSLASSEILAQPLDSWVSSQVLLKKKKKKTLWEVDFSHLLSFLINHLDGKQSLLR